jgi:hypothetical protein
MLGDHTARMKISEPELASPKPRQAPVSLSVFPGVYSMRINPGHLLKWSLALRAGAPFFPPHPVPIDARQTSLAGASMEGRELFDRRPR